MTDISSSMSGRRTKSGADKGSANQQAENSLVDNTHDAVDGETIIEKGRQLAQVAGVKAKKASSVIIARIKEKPLSAVGIAFGTGLGFLLLRR